MKATSVAVGVLEAASDIDPSEADKAAVAVGQVLRGIDNGISKAEAAASSVIAGGG